MESFPPPSRDHYRSRRCGLTVGRPHDYSAEPCGRPSTWSLRPRYPAGSSNCPLHSGDTVPKGAAILVLFNDDLEAQRTALQADLNLVNTQLERNQTLEADALVSRDQLDTLTAQTLSLTAQIAVLNARLSRMTVRAPFTGTLGIYPQRVGDLMHLSEVLTTLTGLNAERWVDFKVPQGLAELSVGDTVTIRDITGNAIGPAKVIAVSDAFAEGTRTYDVRAALQAAGLRHGALVQVAVSTGPREDVLSVPARSVRWDPEGPHAFVVEPSDAGSASSPQSITAQSRGTG